MNNLYRLIGRISPFVVGDVVSTFKTRSEDLIMVLAVVLVAALVLPKMGEGKKIKAIGFLVFGALIIAIIGDINFLVNMIKGIYTYFTGKVW